MLGRFEVAVDLCLEWGGTSQGAGTTCLMVSCPLPDQADLDHDGDTLEPTPVDVDGLPRFMPASVPAVDMVAYEEQGG